MTEREPGPISVDIAAVLEQTTRQRNAALDEVAQLRAALNGLVAERDQLEAERVNLKAES
ncbi:hypothetical protein [Planotetraspora kaengkrachanensis]|uniref:Uncharacterized protein n=1 Tax=Planotetraspora kaengkrachanensis TaxID=575193 RepID=A0A8J3PUS2_9ACTN|nr:hypothetical protein [Planotetraspora kaengkrachanensis]GIG81439.1 hypothetical protein Pka01_45660 [Planotetraspora kaengkrachanensis]